MENVSGRVQKVAATIHVEEILRRLNQIIALKCHIHIKHIQHAKFNSLKSSLQGNDVLIQILQRELCKPRLKTDSECLFWSESFFDIHNMLLFSNRWRFGKRKHNCDL